VGLKVCLDYAPQGSSAVVSVFANGVPHPEAEYWVRWIDASEGYKLAP